MIKKNLQDKVNKLVNPHHSKIAYHIFFPKQVNDPIRSVERYIGKG